MIETRILATTDDGPMTTLVWRPDGDGPFPVVVVYHDGPGLREPVYDIARRVASEGYFAAVPDLYHREGELLSFDTKELALGPESEEFRRLMAVIGRTTADGMVSDTLALVEAAESEPAASVGLKACMGFCHTARSVIRIMAERPEEFIAGAIMHPSWCVTDEPDSAHLFVKQIAGELYAGFGLDDHIAPPAAQKPLIDELHGLGGRATVEIHPGAGHGFFFTNTPAYNEKATASAWHHTLDLFARNLAVSAAA
jgi:carboxymethylenebutenolidase